jgi:hypothetical protein
MPYHQESSRRKYQQTSPEDKLQLNHHSFRTIAKPRPASLAFALVGAAAVVAASGPGALAQQTAPAAREVPARALPAPTTVSPQM